MSVFYKYSCHSNYTIEEGNDSVLMAVDCMMHLRNEASINANSSINKIIIKQDMGKICGIISYSQISFQKHCCSHLTADLKF